MLGPVWNRPFAKGEERPLDSPTTDFGIREPKTVGMTCGLEIKIAWATLFLQTVAGFM